MMVEGNAIILVIDNGSAFCKVGFAGDEDPIAVFPTIVGKPKLVDASSTKDFYVGDEARANRRELSLSFPIRRGIITHWEDMEKIWHHAFFNELKIDPKEHPVIVTEAPLNTKANSRRMAKILFENFEVTALYLANDAVLALYTGRTSGVVLDIGASVTHCVSVYEGYSLWHATIKNKVAGNDLTEYLMKLLIENELSFKAERELIVTVKEKLCYIAQDYDAEVISATNDYSKQINFKLPDGKTVNLNIERFKCPEALFQPYLLGREIKGVHHSLFQSINCSDGDIRDELYENIVLFGGSTLFKGLKDRIDKEMTSLQPVRANIKVTVSANAKNMSWKGGSIIGDMSSFRVVLITKEDYDESGPSIIHRVNF